MNLGLLYKVFAKNCTYRSPQIENCTDCSCRNYCDLLALQIQPGKDLSDRLLKLVQVSLGGAL
jgi:hypothetical protein